MRKQCAYQKVKKIWNVGFIRLKCSIKNSTTLKLNSYNQCLEEYLETLPNKILVSMERHRKMLACSANI
jgi:hypothetical protein